MVGGLKKNPRPVIIRAGFSNLLVLPGCIGEVELTMSELSRIDDKARYSFKLKSKGAYVKGKTLSVQFVVEVPAGLAVVEDCLWRIDW